MSHAGDVSKSTSMQTFTQKYTRSRRALRPAIALVVLVGAAFGAWRLHGNPSAAPPTEPEIAALRGRTPPGMTLIPGGDCWIGTDDADAEDDVKPRRRVAVASFYMDTHEVTNGEYRRFDPKRAFKAGQESLPATNILYAQAEAYAKWAGKRLPTETEWEKAARGTDGRRYPWGDTWDARRVATRARSPHAAAKAPNPLEETTGRVCYIGPQRVRPVGSVPDGRSPYGCEDMAGNAWEWVQGFYGGDPDKRILRGGAVGYGERACRVYARAIEGSGVT